jgi:hypothetical protein
MGWLGRWLGAWAGRWLGYEPEQQQDGTVPFTRFGRIFNPNTDRLFGVQQGSSGLCVVSSSAVILGRTETDDYVRFRVPDTNCPPLPQPNRPLDSGTADFAEPDRWLFGGQYTYPPYWRFSSTMGSALDWVQPAYTCYEGDFLTRVTASPGGSFEYPIYYVCDYFGLFVLLSNGVVGVGFGGWARPAGSTFAVDMVLWHATAGRTPYNAQVNLGTPVHLFVRRSGGTISVGWSVTNANAPDPATEIEVAYGVYGPVQFRLAKDFTMPSTDPPQPPARPISATVSQWRTIYGAPSEIWVETPVVDVGQPQKRQVRGLPQGAMLQWRASNTPFGANDPTPPWSNPTGEYRYWQAKASTTSTSTLIERIEFGEYPALEPVWLRNRFVWLVRTDQNPVVVPFKPVAWSHRVSQITQTTAGYEVAFSDATDEYSLLLQEQ